MTQRPRGLLLHRRVLVGMTGTSPRVEQPLQLNALLAGEPRADPTGTAQSPVGLVVHLQPQITTSCVVRSGVLIQEVQPPPIRFTPGDGSRR